MDGLTFLYFNDYFHDLRRKSRKAVEIKINLIIQSLGYKHVEAYPRKGELTSAQHYHGPLSMYMKAGFSLHKTFSNYDIVRKEL